MFMLWMMVQRPSAAAGASRTGMASTPSSLSPTGVASAFTARFSRLTLALVLAEVALSAAVVVTDACLVSLSPALFTTVAIAV